MFSSAILMMTSKHSFLPLDTFKCKKVVIIAMELPHASNQMIEVQTVLVHDRNLCLAATFLLTFYILQISRIVQDNVMIR